MWHPLAAANLFLYGEAINYSRFTVIRARCLFLITFSVNLVLLLLLYSKYLLLLHCLVGHVEHHRTQVTVIVLMKFAVPL